MRFPQLLFLPCRYLWIGASFEFFSLVALFYAAYRYVFAVLRFSCDTLWCDVA